MSVKPDHKYFMDELGAILEDYAQWYNHVIRSVFYAKDVGAPDLRERPDGFAIWLETAEKDGIVDKSLIELLRNIDQEIGQAASTFYKHVEEHKSPSLEEFDDFRNVYEDFYARVCRLERDSQVSDSGVDADTGMRSMSVFERDLTREMERRARSDTPFCLAAVKIDHSDGFVEDDQAAKDLVQKAAEGVMACLRTFDDAYRKGPFEFVLCLKNTDYLGANAAVNRINRFFQQEDVAFKVDGKEQVVTVSSTIAEILPTDNILELVENLTKDVKKNASDPGTVLQYQELSQLQRFVKDNR